MSITQSQVQNFFSRKKSKESEPVLKFIGVIREADGTLIKDPAYLDDPSDFERVDHLFGNLYLAWDGEDGEETGVIFVGEFVNEEE